MPGSAKAEAALKRRREQYVSKSAGNMDMHLPGSQNRKKGHSKKSGRLRKARK